MQNGHAVVYTNVYTFVCEIIYGIDTWDKGKTPSAGCKVRGHTCIEAYGDDFSRRQTSLLRLLCFEELGQRLGIAPVHHHALDYLGLRKCCVKLPGAVVQALQPYHKEPLPEQERL
jgi:hypothetical protein